MAWLCLLFSGCCCGGYLFFLAKGYAGSDFTVVYPIARSLPVLLVGLGDVIRGNDPSLVGWVGMALVAAGCLLTPMRSFGKISWRRYTHWASLWMVLAALGTVGYSLSDKVAAELIRGGPGSAARYGYFFFLIAFLVYGVLHRRFPPEAKEPQRIGRGRSIAGAVLMFGSYWMVLWAYQLVERASYIVAFRQLSIVLGMIAAFAIYKERGLAVRIIAAVIITAGLILIAVWG
jgi:drug/metabolite transporter (DMT)-like permease